MAHYISQCYLLALGCLLHPSLFFFVFHNSISYTHSTAQYNLLPLSVTRGWFQSQPANTSELDVIVMMSESHKYHIFASFHKLKSQCSLKIEVKNIK